MDARLAPFVTQPKYREPFEPLVPGIDFVRLNDIADLESKFDEVCAVIIEPIQGEGGIYPVSEAFWKRARELATQTRRGADRRRNSVRPGPNGPRLLPAARQVCPTLFVAKPLAGGSAAWRVSRPRGRCRSSPGLHGIDVWRRTADLRHRLSS